MRNAPHRLAMNSLASWLKSTAQQSPDALALLSSQGQWTYRELAAQARSGAAFLHDNGFCPVEGSGDQLGTIAAMAGSANDLAFAALACSVAGIALLPLDPLTVEARWPNLYALGGERLRRLSPLSLRLPDTACGACKATSPNPIALIIATSGSEGPPKAVMLTHANLDYAAAASNERLPLRPGDLWLGCLPLHHIGGLSTLYRCLRAGAALLLHDRFDAVQVWHDLHAHPVTHISLVPTMLARLLDVAAGATPPAALRHALIGGAALSRSLFERARASGWPLNPTWGMSECAAQAATLCQPGQHWQEGEVGTLLPGFEARVNAEGRIALRGPQVMAGYLNPESQMGVGLKDGWLITADLGRIDGAGRITLLGRADDLFNSGGVKVHPLEIESCLAACPGVSDVAVTALHDPLWGDVLVALLIGSANPEQIDGWSRQRLAPAQRPRYLLKVEQLPRNALGKIERPALRALAHQVRSAR
jgi:O-succinylbenzoic acid--CoA ligase